MLSTKSVRQKMSIYVLPLISYSISLGPPQIFRPGSCERTVRWSPWAKAEFAALQMVRAQKVIVYAYLFGRTISNFRANQRMFTKVHLVKLRLSLFLALFGVMWLIFKENRSWPILLRWVVRGRSSRVPSIWTSARNMYLFCRSVDDDDHFAPAPAGA